MGAEHNTAKFTFGVFSFVHFLGRQKNRNTKQNLIIYEQLLVKIQVVEM